MGNTIAEQQEAIRTPLRAFLNSTKGKTVEVKGMWCGDFVGVVTEIGALGAEFSLPNGSTVWLPFCTAMVLKESK